MTLTASCQINIQLIFTLAPAKNLAGKKSYTLRKFPGRGKRKSSKLCFRVLNFGCCVKKRFSQGGTWHSHVKETGLIGRKLKSTPQKRPVWVWHKLYLVPTKRQTDNQINSGLNSTKDVDIMLVLS